MGQKVNPYGFRLGVNKTWKSKWFVDPREYADTLHEDLKLRETLEACPETKGAEISDVEIIRHPQRITIVIETSRPGVRLKALSISSIEGCNAAITAPKRHNNTCRRLFPCGKSLDRSIQEADNWAVQVLLRF